MNIKQNEQIEIALLNITHYKDFKEYEKYNNLDKEDFKEMLEYGNIRDITLSTYNGSTKTFTNDTINNEHIINAIETEVVESDFFNFFEDEFIEENNIKDISDCIRLYTELYYVFTLDNSIYVELD